MPLAIPAAAGREVYNLRTQRGSNVPFLILCFLLLNSPLLFGPPVEMIGFLIAVDLVGVGIYFFWRWLLGRKPQLIAICDNGLVGTAKGITHFTPWTEVVSLSGFWRRGHTGYDVNAKGVNGSSIHYRLARSLLGGDIVDTAVALIVERAALDWVHENLAAKPEALQKMADVLAR